MRKANNAFTPLSNWQAVFLMQSIMSSKRNGGEGGIRTHGTCEGTTVFETAPIDHSGTSPQAVHFIQNRGSFEGAERTRHYRDWQGFFSP